MFRVKGFLKPVVHGDLRVRSSGFWEKIRCIIIRGIQGSRGIVLNTSHVSFHNSQEHAKGRHRHQESLTKQGMSTDDWNIGMS